MVKPQEHSYYLVVVGIHFLSRGQIDSIKIEEIFQVYKTTLKIRDRSLTKQTKVNF